MHLPVVVWILFCVTSGLLCGRSECNTCSPASDIVEHWSGPTVLSFHDVNKLRIETIFIIHAANTFPTITLFNPCG